LLVFVFCFSLVLFFVVVVVLLTFNKNIQQYNKLFYLNLWQKCSFTNCNICRFLSLINEPKNTDLNLKIYYQWNKIVFYFNISFSIKNVVLSTRRVCGITGILYAHSRKIGKLNNLQFIWLKPIQSFSAHPGWWIGDVLLIGEGGKFVIRKAVTWTVVVTCLGGATPSVCSV